MALFMLNYRSPLSLGILAATFGCAGSPPPVEPAPATPPPSSLPPAAVQSTPPAPEAKKPEPPKEEKPVAATPVFRVTEGVATPESVLYDEANDRYLVSNIN